jgi:hypothetical protein
VLIFAGGAILWGSKLQSTIALSTMEAEFTAAAITCAKVLHIKVLLEDLGRKEAAENCKVFIDNAAALHAIQNDVLSYKTKHIDIKYRYLVELAKEEKIVFETVSSANQAADYLTKALPFEAFKRCILKCGMST